MQTFETTEPAATINWTRVNNDVRGNPRYVCHFTNFRRGDDFASYEECVKRANKIGGRKFHNKKYSGGIVFKSDSLAETEAAICELLEKAE